ncbi:MAG: LOW QUALITY PROTEIN: hypothetical protein J3R72DRAFT_428288 [Linnemannia gamsii]|nr:MAG: LOW QUALITY PROTEIN: hypothetical protein J3R72DRAFT_428288 [Linnemannia gamsii]
MGIPYDTEGDLYHRYDKESDRQYDCLAMSLESGLDLLRGLKSLQVVALQDMEVGIYEKESLYDQLGTHQSTLALPTASDTVTSPTTSIASNSLHETSCYRLLVLVTADVIVLHLMRCRPFALPSPSPSPSSPPRLLARTCAITFAFISFRLRQYLTYLRHQY